MRPLRTVLLTIFFVTPLLFRRRTKSTRDDAFRALFAAVAEVYAAGAALKLEWGTAWRERHSARLPERLVFGDLAAESAARDMRFALALLQRNRWKSKVQPLFETVDPLAWDEFRRVAGTISATLAMLTDQHAGHLLGDERDWIGDAIEQFDGATILRVRAERAGDQPRAVAEGSYQALRIAVQLSERLIERRRREALPDAK